jgi:S-adenosylmethionine hydrolase
VLRHAAPFFPGGTIHVAVVDPGVGTERRAIVVESANSFFVGPDNGVLSLAAGDQTVNGVFELANENYHLKPKSATFHGRDVFAPVAAHLSLGVPPPNLGVRLENLTRLKWPEVKNTENGIEGEIIYIDNFGNLVTNVQERDLKSLPREQLAVSLAEVTIHGLASNYAGGAQNDYAALINSWGLLEISCFYGRAHLRSGADIGDPVHVRMA